jgi:hypothetical protein
VIRKVQQEFKFVKPKEEVLFQFAQCDYSEEVKDNEDYVVLRFPFEIQYTEYLESIINSENKEFKLTSEINEFDLYCELTEYVIEENQVAMIFKVT